MEETNSFTFAGEVDFGAGESIPFECRENVGFHFRITGRAPCRLPGDEAGCLQPLATARTAQIHFERITGGESLATLGVASNAPPEFDNEPGFSPELEEDT